MKSAGIIIGLAVGSAISGALGYWSATQIHQAPVATFLWVKTFKLSVDGTLILPLMILFICEALVCMPSIASTSEISGVEVEGIKANTRIQGGILCDATGTLISGLSMSLPMVSHAGNNGVIIVTSNAVSTDRDSKTIFGTDQYSPESTGRILCLCLSANHGHIREVWRGLRGNASGKKIFDHPIIRLLTSSYRSFSAVCKLSSTQRLQCLA